MEKLKKYEEIVVGILNSYAQEWDQSNSAVKSQVIADIEGRHYQLIRIGWINNEEYIHNCIFHFDIINGKVWIQENRTDILIAEELVKQGIDKKDIVLGILPPTLRADSEYASA
ncbi:MAG: XisI protein [Bacteroidota bacterium]